MFIVSTINTTHSCIFISGVLPRPGQQSNTTRGERACWSHQITAQNKNMHKHRFLPCFCACMRMLLSFLDEVLEHTPRPSSRACSGRLSPGWCWQVKPEPQRAVYTPHACPSARAHVMQQPQPGSFTRSAQSFGSGLHSKSAPASHGSQRTTGPMVPASRTNAASAARQSRQGPGILPIKLVTKGQYVSCRAGLRGLFATQRTGYSSPSVFSFTRTSRFIQAEKEPTSHTLLCMNNVNGNPDMMDRYIQSSYIASCSSI